MGIENIFYDYLGRIQSTPYTVNSSLANLGRMTMTTDVIHADS